MGLQEHRCQKAFIRDKKLLWNPEGEFTNCAIISVRSSCHLQSPFQRNGPETSHIIMTQQKAFLPAIVFSMALTVTGLSVQAQTNHAERPRIVAHRGAMTERPESTLAAIRRAIDVGADVVELDVRTSRDGVLFLLHDATLDRTTNGTGTASSHTIAELKTLDAGSSFHETYKNERIPTLAEALRLCHDRIDVLLDLKEQGETYAQRIAAAVQQHGDPKRTILGIRSVDQARRFRRLLPRARQLGFIGKPEEIEAYAKANVDIIRLWAKWLDSSEPEVLVRLVRRHQVQVHLNATNGRPQEILPLLKFHPDYLLVDDPATLKKTLDDVQRNQSAMLRLADSVQFNSKLPVVPWVTRPGSVTFLNRDYQMLELPKELLGSPRILFAGGDGARTGLRFIKRSVVFAVFEYNTTGAWSFPDGFTAADWGWRLVKKNGYRGTSNGTLDGQPHHADIYCRTFDAGTELGEMPPWWVCLGIVTPQEAAQVPGFTEAMARDVPESQPFRYSRWATRNEPLAVPELKTAADWTDWQQSMREEFQRRLVFKYASQPTFARVGEPVIRERYRQQEYHVLIGNERLFRFFKLAPLARPDSSKKRLPTIVCFMGHGKVRQILEDRDSYQHACAAQFAEQGYLVFAMENVGMEPNHDRHHELDRLLRLDGYSWYSLLFAHQQILLDHLFADPQVDTKKVGVTGVSTGGLLALSAVAMDARVNSASVQGIFGSMRVSFIQDRHRHCSCGAIPGLLPKFDLPEMALLAAPRPLHISNAVHDGFSPGEAQRCLKIITPYYLQAGGEEPRFSVPPGRHEYAFEPAAKFFEETIGKP